MTKQLIKNWNLMQQCKDLELTQAEKQNKIKNLYIKLNGRFNANNSETEDSTPKCFESQNLKDPKFYNLEKILEKLVERKKLISNALIFTTRIFHQLENFCRNGLHKIK